MGPAGKEGEGPMEILPLTSLSWPWEEADNPGAPSPPGIIRIPLSGTLSAGTGEFRRGNNSASHSAVPRACFPPAGREHLVAMTETGVVALGPGLPSSHGHTPCSLQTPNSAAKPEHCDSQSLRGCPLGTGLGGRHCVNKWIRGDPAHGLWARCSFRQRRPPHTHGPPSGGLCPIW